MTRFNPGDVAAVESPVFYGRDLQAIGDPDPDFLLGAIVTVINTVDDEGDVLVSYGEGLTAFILEDGLVPYLADVAPLEAPIESLSTHDPYINRTFLAMMDAEARGEWTPEMPDFNRSLVVGLATYDPERPETPAVEEAGPERSATGVGNLDTKEKEENDDARDVLHGHDADGDRLKLAYNKAKGAILIVTDPNGHWLKVADIPALIVWLKSRETKHRGDAAGASA